MQKREDITSIRAIAILLVAFGHSIVLYSSTWNLYETPVQSQVLDHLKNIINMLQIPLFFSVSGFCLVFTMLRGGDGLDARPFLWNKCKRILLPFLIIGLAWMLPIRLLLDYPGYRGQSIPTVILRDFLRGSDNGHLWFLPTLFLMLAISLFLIKICGTGIRLDIAMGAVSLLSWAVFVFAHPLVEKNTYLMQFTFYYFFFALGFIYHRHEAVLRRVNGQGATTPLIPIPVTVIVLAACVALSWNTHSTPIMLVLSAISTLCIYLITPRRSCAPLRLISKDSMGIYLFHSPMLYISFTYWPEINPLLMVLINFVGFGCVAILLTELMRRIHCGVVIGE
ncbi:acyltransferase family protein [Bifidobacterium aesculapii]|uniref:acyltransferase family protein n=1 Tax=Bifidobacterium aesculapii TaxID=1329411 RepID=UPI0006E13A20|nr:acyltransferase [Bifidobacterium aesculapii]